MSNFNDIFKDEHFSDFNDPIDRRYSSLKAQEVLDQFIKDNAIEIRQYKDKIFSHWNTLDVIGLPKIYTHKGLLINVEKAKDCEHTNVETKQCMDAIVYICKDCEELLEPSAYKVKK